MRTPIRRGPVLIGNPSKLLCREGPLFGDPPDEGAAIAKDQTYGEVESVKAVSDLIAPLSGEVLEVNAKVVDAPETVNEDPYGAGWLFRLEPNSAADLAWQPF